MARHISVTVGALPVSNFARTPADSLGLTDTATGVLVLGGGGTITHGFQITTANTGHTAYIDPALGRAVTDADLTVHSGAASLSSLVSSGGTLKRHWFRGGCSFDIGNVTLVACRFDQGITLGQPTVTFNYCTVDTPDGSAGDQAIAFNDYVAYRCRLLGNSDGGKVNGNCRLTECYIRTNGQAADDHHDGLQGNAAYTGSTIERCNIDCRPANGIGGLTGAIFIADASNGTYEVHDNFVAGGSSPLRFHENGHYNASGNWILDGSYSGAPVNALYGIIDSWSDNWLVNASGTKLSAVPSP